MVSWLQNDARPNRSPTAKKLRHLFGLADQLSDILLLGRTFGGVAPDEFVDSDSREDDRSNDGELKVRGDSHQVDGVVEQAQHCRGDDDAQDGAFATAKAAAAKHGCGDGVEFIKVSRSGGLHGV